MLSMLLIAFKSPIQLRRLTTTTVRASAVLQVFQTSAQVTDVVGLANAGISSDIAKRMHKQQVSLSDNPYFE
jgi:hypothetical protein